MHALCTSPMTNHPTISTRFPGVVHWFTFGDTQTLDTVLSVLFELGITELRTCFSWADWERPQGRVWFDYYIDQLRSAGITLFPSLFYTPLSKARPTATGAKLTSCPPQQLEDFTVFTQSMLDRYGDTFTWIQLWNEPNWEPYWNQELDPDGKLFAQMVDPAIDACHRAGKRVVLGGLTPIDVGWINRMLSYGVLQKAQAVGVHGAPGSWYYRGPNGWNGWPIELQKVRDELAAHNAALEVWITETGASTFLDGVDLLVQYQFQIEYFEYMNVIPADRVWWYSVIDQHPDQPTDDVITMAAHEDRVAYHFGLLDFTGKQKPLYTHWKNRAHGVL